MFPPAATHPAAESFVTELSKFSTSIAVLTNVALYEQERTYSNENYQQLTAYNNVSPNAKMSQSTENKTREGKRII